jgi:hypothetical protein
MTDVYGFEQKQRIRFRVGTGKTYRNGTYHGVVPAHPGVVLVQLDGDPYAVCVSKDQVEHNTASESQETGERIVMATATATKPTAKELRREARTLGVEGWEEMTGSELKTAVKRARKGADSAPAEAEPKASKKAAAKAAKAAPAKKSSKAKEAEPTAASETGNPFKVGSNLYHITEELLKGGKRSAMVTRLARKITLKPRQRAGEDYDETAELDRRVLIVGQILERDHGFTVTREGRGKDALIKATKD